MKPTRFLAAAFLFVAGGAFAANVTKVERYVQDAPLNVGGAFVIENPYGDIEIVGTEEPGVHAKVVKTMIGVDDAAIAQAQNDTQLRVAGDEHTRILRTLVPTARNPRWSSTVTYQLRIPRTVHVRVVSSASNFIRITNITGNVYVNNFSGSVLLRKVVGAATVESVNGSIIFDPVGRPRANAALSTLNGDIHVYVAPDAAFDWVAETLAGEYRTTLGGMRGRYSGNLYRASINNPGGPTVRTSTGMGRVFMLKSGSTPTQAQVVRDSPNGSPDTIFRTIREQVVSDHWRLEISGGDVNVNEARGSVYVSTGAGQVHLGSVRGTCNILSGGGPLSVGDAFSSLVARTKAGDVIVNAARKDSALTTGGGTIRLAYTNGPTNLISGGGDIILRHAGGPVFAQTRSGDISIAVDPASKTQKLEAKTSRGNIAVSVARNFAADVFLSVLTDDPTASSIKTDFPGLTFSQEQVGGGKTLVRATGKINGGGERVELSAEGGGIQFTSRGPLLTSR